MSIRRITAVTLAALWLPLLVPAPTLAQGPSQGRITLGGEDATFDGKAALLDSSRNHVSVLVTPKPLAAEVEAAARKAGRWDAAGAGKALVIDLDFAPGSTSAMVNELTSCRITAYGFRAPLELKGSAKECHLTSSGGLLRSGGAMVGLLEGKGTNYSLRVPFAAAFMEAVTTTAASAASAPGGRAGAPAGDAPPGVPPNTGTGSGTYTGQRLTFTHGLAWFEAEHNAVNVALFEHVPPPDIVAGLKAGSWGEGGPTFQMELRFTRGAAAAAAAVTYCWVNLAFPKGGPMSNNTDAKGCGIAELGGDPKAGGTIVGVAKGQAIGPGDKPYTWDVKFNLPISR